MQTFKEIPYQNYIELKFNQKNLNQVQQQEALIKYKRNAQLLAQIFSFKKVQNQTFKTQNKISEEQLASVQKQIQRQKEQGEDKLRQIKEQSQKYEQMFNSIKEMNSKQQLQVLIEELKKNDLYDNTHPFFVENSPFYLNTTQDQYLEVKDFIEEQPNDQGLSFLQIN